MISKERVIRAIEFGGPDKVPNGCYYLPGALDKYSGRLLSLFKAYPRDFAESVWGDVREIVNAYSPGVYTDKWGCVWKNVNPGLLGRIIEHPLKDLGKLDSYELPDPTELVNFELVKKVVDNAEKEGKYVLGDGDNFFERIHWLHGFEDTLFDIAVGRKELNILVGRLLKFKIDFIGYWLDAGIDGLYCLDDWGTMKGLMISPGRWRELFKPCYKQMFHEVRKRARHLFFHSDGKVLDIIPDLVEIGANAINVQASLIGVDMLAARFAGKACMLPDIDRQRLLPFGKPSEIMEHIRYLVEKFGSLRGGIIAWGEIGPDVPLGNAEAMLYAFSKYGTY
nr:uroporphyrinogen decarboxylase family protein [Candidatus Njordarchaeum guaymaensis]